MSKPGKTEKEKNQHIQVYVRCRPLNSKEKRQGSFGVVETGDREIHIKDRTVPTAPTKTFSFDKVYGQHSKQIEVYKQVVSPIVDEVLSGYNCTVFAYGQTGTGKTFTMEGERTLDRNVSWEEDPLAGIIPRAMHQLFTRLNMMGCEFSVRVSFLEIYNEELIDLLGAESVENPRLRIYEDQTRKGSCIIQGLEEVVVRSKDEIYKIMDQGSARRQTAATLMNAHSSRSHSLFMVTIHIKENSVDGEEMMKTGKLNLVDLAGSECIGRSGAVEKRAREAGNINQSLLTLGRVITALVEHAPHVPYRESKLTRLLQDSLGGRTKTSIIATISPASCNLDETLSTLDYAFRAKNITNRPEINQRLSKKTYLKECNEEIERLRRDLQAARDKNGVYLAQDNYDEMQVKIQQQKDSIMDLTDRIALITTEMFKVTELFEETKEELVETENKLTETKDTLSHTCDVLDKTRLSYQVTIQDRDEQRYLVSHHVTTEKKLSSQANQLLTTSNEASTDVSGLHAKLERKTKVEEHNQSTLEMFRDSFRENIDSMKNSLTNFSEGQVRASSEVKNSLGGLVEQRTSEVSELCSGLGQMVDNLKSHINKLEEEETAHMANSREWAEDLKKHCLQTKEEEVNRQGNFHERTFLSSMMEIQCSLKQHITSLQELAAVHTSQMETQQARFADFVREMQSRLHAEADMAKSLTNTMETNLAERQQEMQYTVESQNSQNKELADKLAANVSQLIQEMITSQQSHLVTNTTKVQQGHDQMLGQVQTFGTSAASHINAAISYGDEGLAGLNKLTSENNTAVQDTMSQQCKHLHSVIEQQDGLKTQVSSFTQQTTESCTSQTNQILDMVEQHTAALTVAHKAHKEGMEVASTECSSKVDTLREEQTNQQTALTSGVEAQQTQIDALSNEVSDWSKGMLKALEDRNAHVEKLITEETRKDLPTGSTPKAREFSYPRTLARTDRHSMILNDFRRSYVLREVTDLPLPNTSFDSVASEVEPLDLDADLEDYDQNCSADSAFSTASAVSSNAAADQPDLEEGTQNGTDKENNMQPPKTKMVVKNQRTTLHRSRSRSGKETPTSKKSGSTSKTPSKTPSSQRQSRTRLPLRTSNPAN